MKVEILRGNLRCAQLSKRLNLIIVPSYENYLQKTFAAFPLSDDNPKAVGYGTGYLFNLLRKRSS